MRFVRGMVLVLVLAAGCRSIAAPRDATIVAEGSTLQLALLETTDLHSNLLSYDYYRAKVDPTLGFERVATLIGQARAEYPNTLLFDAGDTIQGTVLADYQATVEPAPCARALAIHQAMDLLGYDGGTVGNHDFNYGLPFLAQVTDTPMRVSSVTPRNCAGPHYPLVLSNLYSDLDDQPLFRPWTVIARNFAARAPDGSMHSTSLRIGLLGFTPPQIMDWDHRNLAGRVHVRGVVESARRWLPELQAQHPDVIVAIVHGGPDASPDSATLENAAWHLAGVKGIDALMLGHMHRPFPGSFAELPEVDAVRGRLRGVPAVMAGFWGKYLGIIHLDLQRAGGRWQIDRAAAHSELRPICSGPDQCVAPDPRIAPLAGAAHRGAIAYLEQPIGSIDFRLNSYFAEVGDGASLAIVNAAQRDYVAAWIARERPQWRDLPLLSAASAFKTGYAGPADYTDIAPGPLSLRSAADLYLFNNQLSAVRIDGAALKRWLETAARRFQRIDPARSDAQPLLDPAFAGFNFDQFQGEGLRYRIDLSQPAGARIIGLRLRGQPLAPNTPVIVATNTYRAHGSAAFPELDGSQIVMAAADGTREVIIDWLRRHPHLRRDDLPATAWSFAELKTQVPPSFVSASGLQPLAAAAGLNGITQLQDLGDGRARYALPLTAGRP